MHSSVSNTHCGILIETPNVSCGVASIAEGFFVSPCRNVDDLKRTENEYELMVKVAKISPECVVAPLVCLATVFGGIHYNLVLTTSPPSRIHLVSLSYIRLETDRHAGI